MKSHDGLTTLYTEYASNSNLIFRLYFYCLQYYSIGTFYNQLMYVFSLLTAVDCGPLTDPANGQVSHPDGTTFGQTATYSCNTGYNLVGDSTRTCQATGNWSGNAPICECMLYCTRWCSSVNVREFPVFFLVCGCTHKKHIMILSIK